MTIDIIANIFVNKTDSRQGCGNLKALYRILVKILIEKNMTLLQHILVLMTEDNAQLHGITKLLIVVNRLDLVDDILTWISLLKLQ